MSLPQFLNSLLYEGRVRVDPILDRNGRIITTGVEELHDAAVLVEAFELEYRSDLAHQPPPLSRDAMLWAASFVQRACGVLTYRDIDADGVRRALSDPCPESPSCSVVYSVDLILRFLPDVIRLARAASPDDPLVHHLTEIARQWPLSSVGIGSIDITEPLDWLDDPCLQQIYVDRILAEQQESRLDDPRVREAVQTAVGRHPQLTPKLVTRLAMGMSPSPFI